MGTENLITANRVVSLHYKLTASTGQVIDESGDEPLVYLHGHENIVPGLERQLDGKSVGDKVKAVVSPEEGYGERNEAGQQQVPRDAFPEDAPVEAGSSFAAEGPDGKMIQLWVMGVEGDVVTVDLNHPLAGETLTFDVEIVTVRDATKEELDHGHVHGVGGAHD